LKQQKQRLQQLKGGFLDADHVIDYILLLLLSEVEGPLLYWLIVEEVVETTEAVLAAAERGLLRCRPLVAGESSLSRKSSDEMRLYCRGIVFIFE
jgi:hypothetical protein